MSKSKHEPFLMQDEEHDAWFIDRYVWDPQACMVRVRRRRYPSKQAADQAFRAAWFRWARDNPEQVARSHCALAEDPTITLEEAPRQRGWGWSEEGRAEDMT